MATVLPIPQFWLSMPQGSKPHMLESLARLTSGQAGPLPCSSSSNGWTWILSWCNNIITLEFAACHLEASFLNWFTDVVRQTPWHLSIVKVKGLQLFNPNLCQLSAWKQACCDHIGRRRSARPFQNGKITGDNPKHEQPFQYQQLCSSGGPGATLTRMSPDLQLARAVGHVPGSHLVAHLLNPFGAALETAPWNVWE